MRDGHPRFGAHAHTAGQPSLARHRVIQFTALTPAPQWTFTRRGEPVTVSVTPGLVTNSADAATGHAERGGGLAMVLAYQVAEAVKAKRLAVVLEGFEPPPLPIHVLYPSGRLLTAKVRAFVDLINATRRWRFVEL